MSDLTQMLGLAVQNFLSSATGIVVVIALIRGFVRHSSRSIGNAWVDLTRVTLWVLLPIALISAVFFVQQAWCRTSALVKPPHHWKWSSTRRHGSAPRGRL